MLYVCKRESEGDGQRGTFGERDLAFAEKDNRKSLFSVEHLLILN